MSWWSWSEVILDSGSKTKVNTNILIQEKVVRINKSLKFKIVIYILLSISCKTNISSNKKAISGSDYKLWREIKDSSKYKGSFIRYWYFDKKGKNYLYVKYKNQTKIVRLDLSDITLNDNWNIVEGKKVSIGGKTYKIDVLNDTCFSFKDTTNYQETKLVYKGDKL